MVFLRKNKINFFTTIFIVVAFFVVGVVYLYTNNAVSYKQLSSFFCDKQENYFDNALAIKDELGVKESTFIVNNDNTIKYLYENFDNYGDVFSHSLENFENLDGVTVSGNITDLHLKEENYNGEYSLAFVIKPLNNKETDYITIKKDFKNALNLSRWNNVGFLTAWIKIAEREGVESVKMRIGNKDGSYREFNELLNLQTNMPNVFNKDDIFPDIQYPVSNSSSDEWTDFYLSKGWNYLLFRTDKSYYADFGNFDNKEVVWLEAVLKFNSKMPEQKILIDDIRIQDGLQEKYNSLGGVWFPPHGRPQYGVFDVDKKDGSDYSLKLLNVRQSQYPSNGDHGRFISKYASPLNFVMRARFKLTDFPKNKDFTNTWFRMMYDFDPQWDPGHDWFGAYLSLDYNKFGLITVIPIERFLIQEQEPAKENIMLSSENFSPRKDTLYDLYLIVNGQNSKSIIYEVNGDCPKKRKEVEYEFKRQRYTKEKRYPFTLEITGNIKAVFDEIEIMEI